MNIKVKEIKTKLYQLKNIFRWLDHIINCHKTQGEWKVNSGNTVIDYKTQGEWKIQLTMTILYLLKILMKLVPCIQKVII